MFKKYTTFNQLLYGLLLLFLAAIYISPGAAQAAVVCETVSRTCLDSSSRTVTAGGKSFQMSAPILSGYSSACWRWQENSKCIETTPEYKCDSGRSFETVKNSCYVSHAQIHKTESIQSIGYILDASYNYRCDFTEWSEDGPLPEEAECVQLATEYQDTTKVPSLPLGTHPTSGTSVLSFTAEAVIREDRSKRYACYDVPTTECTDVCFETKHNPATGSVEQVEVSCSNNEFNNCALTAAQCDGEMADDDQLEDSSLVVGPDGRCIEKKEWFMCEGTSVPKCLNESNCSLESSRRIDIQSNGLSMFQEQSYVCTDETVTCTEMEETNSCMTVSAWGWDQYPQGKPSSGQGLGEFNQAFAQLDAMDKGLDEDDIHVFSGQNLKCTYAVGNFLNTAIMIALVAATMIATGGASTGMTASVLKSAAASAAKAGAISAAQAATIAASANAIGAAVSIGGAAIQDAPSSQALGSDCCKSHVVEGSDAWYKFGKCTIDEVKLSVARRKGLYHYLGTYCSKRSGFPVRQCVQKTKSYCVFDDMLGLVINKQGRAQLDNIAAADESSASSSGDIHFNLYAPVIESDQYSGKLNNGGWLHLITQAGSPVWYWQYPGYCSSPELHKKALDLHEKEAQKAADIKGFLPGTKDDYQGTLPDIKDVEFELPHFDEDAALGVVADIAAVEPFQECADGEGVVHFLTCATGNCDASKLPESPEGNMFDIYGENVDEADMNWRTQQVRANYKPGDYGVTATMSSNSGFAAMSSSISGFVTATGSCQGVSCLFKFTFSDRGGIKKRISEYAGFPLYTLQTSASLPAIDYLSVDGHLDTGHYSADPNKGLGNDLDLNKQRFIFRPNHLSSEVKGKLHSHVLLEWAAYKGKPESEKGVNSGGGQLPWGAIGGKDKPLPPETPSAWNPNPTPEEIAKRYKPVLVPTDLPPNTPGFYPYGNSSDGYGHFYISGGCDINSRWCSYEIEASLNIERHPWGSAKNPRCWGFTVEQVAALDFDQMDLSQWLNSLDLDSMSAGLDGDMAEAFAEQVMSTAQSTYSSFKDGSIVTSQQEGSKALVTNTNTLPLLSGEPYKAYVLNIAVPSNWPAFYDDKPNDNDVYYPMVDWGDGSPEEYLYIHEDGRIYYQEHDYGDKPESEYKVTVRLETQHNGTQVLTTLVKVTPNAGAPKGGTSPDFSSPGTVGQHTEGKIPSKTLDGTVINEERAATDSPGTSNQYENQGGLISTGK